MTGAPRVDLGPLPEAPAGGLYVRVGKPAIDGVCAFLGLLILAPLLLAAPSAARLAITVPGALGGVPWAMLSGMSGTPFTLATSVTTASGKAASSEATTSAVTSGGTATTMSEGWSSSRAARPAP